LDEKVSRVELSLAIKDKASSEELIKFLSEKANINDIEFRLKEM
jgi:hypothetical protein